MLHVHATYIRLMIFYQGQVELTLVATSLDMCKFNLVCSPLVDAKACQNSIGFVGDAVGCDRLLLLFRELVPNFGNLSLREKFIFMM